MKKQYITPSIIVREYNVRAMLHTLSGAKIHTGANNENTDGWNGGNDIDVGNGEMPGGDPWDDFLR